MTDDNKEEQEDKPFEERQVTETKYHNHNYSEITSELNEEERQWLDNKLGYPYDSCPNPDERFESSSSNSEPSSTKHTKTSDADDPKKVSPTEDQWRAALLQKHENLYKLVKELVPELWTPLEFAISIKNILNIKDCTLPFAGILLGPPASLKTVVVELFTDWNNSYYTDNFSAKAFVSHNSAVNEKQLLKIDMLPKIRNKFFLCSELSPMFTKKDEELKEIIGIITRVLDGHGLVTDTGACGQRGYKGGYMFVWLGAAVDIPYKVHKLLGSIGPKLYFLRLPKIKKTEEQLLTEMDSDDFIPKIRKIHKLLIDYLKWFDLYPKSSGKHIEKEEIALTKIKWNSEKDDDTTKRILIRLATLLSHLRAVVTTWETNDTQGIDYAYATAIREEPQRALTQLRNLARGHALSQGRNFITIEDLMLPIKVVLSTASVDRVNIFDLLISQKGTLTTSDITSSLNISPPTARRIMAELKAVQIVEIEVSESETAEKAIRIKNEFLWFLSDEFRRLRHGFKPNDNSSNLEECCQTLMRDSGSLKEKTPSREVPGSKLSYNCYYCKKAMKCFSTNSKSEYEEHVLNRHPKRPCFPGKADLKKYDLEPQYREWEL